MKKYISPLMLAGVMLVTLTGCGDEIKKVIDQNTKGLQKQDIKMVMDTIDPKSPDYSNTEKQLERLLQDYNLEFKVESIDIMERPKDEKKKDEKEGEAKPAEEDIFAEVDNDYVTEEDRKKAEEARKKKEEEEKNKPFVARVKVIQVTKQKQGANEYKDNRITVVHTLHKYPQDEKPVWKIFKSNIRDVEFLNAEGEPLTKSDEGGEHSSEEQPTEEHGHGSSHS